MFQRFVNLLQRLWARLSWTGGVHYLNGGPGLPPPLTPEEEKALLARMADGDPAARDELITHNLRLVVYLAKKYEGSGVPSEDMVSIGTIGLIKAVNTFTPERSIKLATYASRCIGNEILMYLRKSSNRRQEASIDEPLNIDGDGNELLLSDVLSSEENQVGQRLEQDAERASLRRSVEQLSPRERQIMELRFGLLDGVERTQKEVADAIGISQSYISRLEKRTGSWGGGRIGPPGGGAKRLGACEEHHSDSPRARAGVPPAPLRTRDPLPGGSPPNGMCILPLRPYFR